MGALAERLRNEPHRASSILSSAPLGDQLSVLKEISDPSLKILVAEALIQRHCRELDQVLSGLGAAFEPAERNRLLQRFIGPTGEPNYYGEKLAEAGVILRAPEAPLAEGEWTRLSGAPQDPELAEFLATQGFEARYMAIAQGRSGVEPDRYADLGKYIGALTQAQRESLRKLILKAIPAEHLKAAKPFMKGPARTWGLMEL
ncbi:MAG: hypothetical protein KC492_25015, partial [Myxococcales bacterium]|nr:hypothetical protein [Myxococcales bacterium]